MKKKQKKSESPAQHCIFMSLNYYEIYWNYLCETHVHRKIGYQNLTDVKLAYTSTHTNKSNKTCIYKVLWVVSVVSKYCSKFWKDCYDSKTDATCTQRSIYIKNLENCLFRELGVIRKNVLTEWHCRMTFFWAPLPPMSHFAIFLMNSLLLSHSLKH